MNKQQLANYIWESANKMRSTIDANEYKDFILGFIFYKFLSEKEEKWLLDRDYTKEDIQEYVNEEDTELVDAAKNNLGYFIAYKDLFSTWINMGSDFSVDHVRTALSSFNRLISENHKKVYEKIFTTLETGLSKLGENTKSQTGAVSDLIHLINRIPMESRKDYDVLGYIYEYLIEKFASNAGKKAGEFYTPHEVSLVMSQIVAYHLKDENNIKIYDPTSGSGSLLINIGEAVLKYLNDSNSIKYYAQEINSSTYNLTRMNLVMRGILPNNIVTRNADTLEEDWPYFDESDPAGTYEPLYVDAVVSNPPYSQDWNRSDKENDPRYASFGLAPASKADYAFLLHDLYHIKPNGIMTIVLPHGVLFRGGEEGEIRKNLIEKNHIDTIIGLPANIFYGTGIPTIIMILKQKRENSDVLIIDASKEFVKEGKNNKLRACDIRKIVDTYISRRDVEKYSRKVSKEEIRENDYNLNIPRYVDSSESDESYDIYASMFGGVPEHEIDALHTYWRFFPNLKNDLFEIKNGYGKIRNEDINQIIENHKEVQEYMEKFSSQFKNFEKKLNDNLLHKQQEIQISQLEENLVKDLFNNFSQDDLVDQYTAYEIFHEKIASINGDLEIIQMEGIDAVRKVDPNMVTKKKGGKEVEVQDGWKGHILPFELVQKVLMKEDLDEIRSTESKMNEISSEYESILEELTEEDKDTISEALNEEKSAFEFKNISSTLKKLKQNNEDPNLIDVLNKVLELNKNEKELKQFILQSSKELESKTTTVVESLSIEEVNYLLQEKWINPMIEGINKLAKDKVKELEKNVTSLAKKYEDTLESIEMQIKETEKSLVEMMSKLTGSESDMEGIKELQKLLGGI